MNNNDIIELKYNEDNNGLFQYLGTNFGTSDEWINPCNRGFVDVYCGGIDTRSNKMENLLNKKGIDCYFTSGKLGIWLAVDLGSKYVLSMTKDYSNDHNMIKFGFENKLFISMINLPYFVDCVCVFFFVG